MWKCNIACILFIAERSIYVWETLGEILCICHTFVFFTGIRPGQGAFTSHYQIGGDVRGIRTGTPIELYGAAATSFVHHFSRAKPAATENLNFSKTPQEPILNRCTIVSKILNDRTTAFGVMWLRANVCTAVNPLIEAHFACPYELRIGYFACISYATSTVYSVIKVTVKRLKMVFHWVSRNAKFVLTLVFAWHNWGRRACD